MAQQTLNIPAFGGLDQSSEGYGGSIAMSPDTQNMRLGGGTLSTGRGSTAYAPTLPHSIGTLMPYHRRNADGTITAMLLAAAGDSIYKLEPGRFTQLRQNLTSDRFSHIGYQSGERDMLILANGKDDTLTYDGTQFAPLGQGANIEPCQYLALHYERVWAAGNGSYPDRVYHSRAMDPSDWSSYDATDATDLPEIAGGFHDVPTWDGSVIRGIATLFDDVVLFKDQSIHRVVGTYPGEYALVRVHGTCGTVSPRSVVQVKNQVYFWSAEGLCVFDGNSAAPVYEARIGQLVQRVHPQALEGICAAHHHGVLYFALPEGDSPVNNLVLEYDLRQQQFMLRRGVTVQDFCVFDGALLFADDAGNTCYYGRGEDDRGQALACHWQSPWVDLSGLNNTKITGRIYLSGTGEGDQPQMQVSLQSDRSSRIKTRQIHFSGDGKVERKSLRIRGRRIRLRIENIQGRHFTLQGGIGLSLESDAD